MLKQNKINLANELIKLKEEKNCIVILKHKKLNFTSIDNARRKAGNGTIIKKIKNKIAKKAFKTSNFETVCNEIKEENIFIFSNDIFSACNSAQELINESENVSIYKAAFNESEDLNSNTIQELIQLKSKEALQSKVLNVISELSKQTIRVIRCKIEKESNNEA